MKNGALAVGIPALESADGAAVNEAAEAGLAGLVCLAQLVQERLSRVRLRIGLVTPLWEAAEKGSVFLKWTGSGLEWRDEETLNLNSRLDE